MNHQDIKQAICRLLGISDEAYAQAQYEAGLQYLQLYLHGLPQEARELEGNRIYWNWWRNHWAMRDQQLLQQVQYDAPAANYCSLYSLWQQQHDAAMLAAEMRPSAVVLGHDYARMIGKLIKAEVAR